MLASHGPTVSRNEPHYVQLGSWFCYHLLNKSDTNEFVFAMLGKLMKPRWTHTIGINILQYMEVLCEQILSNRMDNGSKNIHVFLFSSTTVEEVFN